MEEVVVAAEPDVSTSDSRDPERFYCPHMGCNRSFAELWRLKVHYRAPPDVRGSGKERGHGTELEFCPKCNKDLKPGKHHVGCSASKRQSKRTRQQGSSEQCPPDTTAAAARASLGSDLSHDFRPKSSGFAAEDHSNVWAQSTSLVAPTPHPHQPHPLSQQPQQQHYPHLQHFPMPAAYSYAAGPNGMPMSMWPMPGSMHHPPFAVMLPHGSIHPYQLMAMHGHPPLPQFHPEPQQQPQQPSTAPAMVCAAPTPAMVSPAPVEQRNTQLAQMFDDEEVERVPSPPPLPPDFAAQQASASSGHTMLFNFGQFAQRMPVAQPVLTGANKLVKDLTQEAVDLAEANVVYETHDDGDLMELLFGVADEMPTMATFHLHTFASEAQQDEGEGEAQAAQEPGVTSGDMQPFHQSNGGEQQQQQQQQQEQQPQQQQPHTNGSAVHSNGSAPEHLGTCHIKHEQPHAATPKGLVALKQEHPSNQQLDECFQLSGEHYEPCAQLARAAQPGIGLV